MWGVGKVVWGEGVGWGCAVGLRVGGRWGWRGCRVAPWGGAGAVACAVFCAVFCAVGVACAVCLCRKSGAAAGTRPRGQAVRPAAVRHVSCVGPRLGTRPLAHNPLSPVAVFGLQVQHQLARDPICDFLKRYETRHSAQRSGETQTDTNSEIERRYTCDAHGHRLL